MSPLAQVALQVGMLFGVLTFAALMIWVERRFLGLMQDRLGPNRVGPAGILQSAADGLKMLAKEDWVPPFADKPVFVLAPAIVVFTSLLAFAIVPWGRGIAVADVDVALLLFLALSGLGVYGVALAGWSSGNKYALLAVLRAAAQLLSYELTMGLSLVGVVMLAGSFRLGAIVEAQATVPNVVLQPLGFLLFVTAGIAETRRLPFDLPESENELVAGYHIEYSGMKFAMFFLGEYVALTLLSLLIATLFLGGWQGPLLPGPVWLALKTFPLLLVFVWVRGTFPRPRFDQLVAFGWKVLLPLALLNLVITGAVALALRG